MKVARKRGRKLDARHSGRGDCPKQTAERRRAFEAFQPVFDAGPVTVYVLPDQMNLFVTKRLKIFNFRDDLACRTAALAATRVRHDAERTKLVTAFDDRNERNMRRVSRGWRNVPRVSLTAFTKIENS